MKRSVCLAGVSACAISFFPVSLPAASMLLPQSFAYQPIRQLPRVDREWRRSGVVVRELTIPGSSGGGRKAFVVVPRGSGPFAGALMVHWLGDKATSNRSEFLTDAVALAKHGVLSVLPDAMWSVPDWYERVRTYATDYSRSLDQVRDLRRAMDVLLLEPGVDPRRIAYVGHDFGGMYGAVFSGIDHRARFYVVMCATAAFSDWYLYLKPPKDRAKYVAKMSTLDPTRYLARANIDDALFQYARDDRYVPASKMNDLYFADAGRKALRIYQAKHDLRVPAAIRDRRMWLLHHLDPRAMHF